MEAGGDGGGILGLFGVTDVVVVVVDGDREADTVAERTDDGLERNRELRGT